MNWLQRAKTVLPSLGLMVAAGPVDAAAPCPTLPGDLPGACLATPAGWFYARTPEDAERLAADAAQAGEDFLRHFGRAPARGAVLAVGTSGRIDEAQRRVLREAGVRWLLPWLDPYEQQALRRQHLRSAIARQLGELATGERIEQALARALSAAAGPTAAPAVDRGALRHEIGHLLLIAGFWPDALSGSSADGGRHYGGPGPDWLDEVAAVLLEAPDLVDARRAALREARERQALPPLEQFLGGNHPLRAWALNQSADAAAATTGGGAEGFVRVVSGEEARSLADQGGLYYAQARGFADFLQAHGGAAVFGAIAAALAEGQAFEAWLAESGPGHGLPAGLNALQERWESWLDGR